MENRTGRQDLGGHAVRRPRRNGQPAGPSPDPSEIVLSTEIAIIEQIQEQIEETMVEVGMTRDELAAALGLTRAMTELLLDGPGATLRDLAAVAAVLGISFKVTRYTSGG